MEIQDRNSLLQVLSVFKDGKTQILSEEANVFADILKSAQNEVSFPQRDSKDVELKQLAQQKEVAKTAKDVLPDNEKPQKTENKNKDVPEDKKEDVKQVGKKEDAEKDAPATNDSADNETKEVEESSQGTDIVVEEEKHDNGIEKEPQDVEAVVTVTPVVIQEQVFDELVSVEAKEAVVNNDIDIVEQKTPVLVKEDDLLTVEKQLTPKQETEVKAMQVVAEDFVVLSEEEKLLMEQAKYFDEKIVSDKKLKINVNVSEAKIAEPVVKDVLQNRFEVDSMFQAVDENSEVLTQDVEVIADDMPLEDKKIDVLPEVKNALIGDIKVAQDTVNTQVSKDSSVVAVSGKEVVAEVANISKNEAFARINETSSRDVFKGMGKEVVEQIKVNITKSAIKGVDTIDIQLKPEDLGKLQIKLHIAKDGKVQAEIIASRAETADLLQKDVSSLSKAFNEAGYETDAKSFTFSHQNERQANAQDKNDAELLKFIGDTLEQEAEGFAGNDNFGYDPALGLNIRV